LEWQKGFQVEVGIEQEKWNPLSADAVSIAARAYTASMTLDHCIAWHAQIAGKIVQMHKSGQCHQSLQNQPP